MGNIAARRLPGLLLILGFAVLAPCGTVHSACNLIPPAEQAFPSTLGTITSPITTAAKPVELRLSSCDGSPGFHPTPAQNAIVLTFLPPGGGATTDVAVGPGAVTLADCAASGGPCTTLRFTMPSTPTLAGPARITVTNLVAGAPAAVIDTLFQPIALGATCDKALESVFRSFTVLPPPNVYAAVCTDPMAPCTGGATEIRATLDGSGSLLIPFDYRAVLPLGPGEPVARLLSGTTTIDAFSSAPGVPITLPSTAFVRSFTIDGRPLPPLLRATADGGKVYGASDGAEAIIRIARTDGAGGPPIFDFTDRLSNAGRGPILVPNGQYDVASDAAIPLENLRSTAAGIAYTRPEALEGNLNGDGDTDDDVVQIIDAATFASTNTGKAASLTNNPIVGGAVVETVGSLAAFLESERGQGDTDLNGDGDRLDDILRVYTLAGTEITPDASRAGSPFPGIGRRPLAIDGALTYYRTPGVGVVPAGELPRGAAAGAITADGRLFVTVTSVDPLLVLQRRDAEAGDRDGLDSQLGSTGDGAQHVVVTSGGTRNLAFAAAGSSNQVTAWALAFSPGEESPAIGNLNPIPPITDGIGGVDGLAGVSRLAPSPGGEHLYAVARGDDAVTTFAIDINPMVNPLTFVGTIKNGVGGVTNLVDPSDVVVSPDGRNVYVAVQGSSRIRAFTRDLVTGALTFLADYVDGAAGGSLLGGVIALAVSPDGHFVYAVADTDDSLVHFARDAGTGLLTLGGSLTNGGPITVLDRLRDVAVSPDGQMLYVTNGAAALGVFARPGSGAPAFVQQLGYTGVLLLGASYQLTVSPDSEFVYVHHAQAQPDGGQATRIFRRTSGLRAFDAGSATDRPGLAGTTSALAAVAAGRAAYIDPTLAMPVLYDAQSDTLTPIAGVVPSGRIALSARLLVVSVGESALGDVTGDGDADDEVVVAMDPADPLAPPVPIPAQATAVGATDVCDDDATNAGAACTTDADCPDGGCVGVVILISEESAAPAPAQFDLNGDGDRFDRVLQLWRSDTGTLINTGLAASDFAVAGNLVAFRVEESLQGDRELNFDDDTSDDRDSVLHVYDLLGQRVLSTAQAVIRCDLPGCEPGLPYRIGRDAVYFLTRESDQGSTDLNGDLDTLDTVVQVFNVRTVTNQVLDDAPEGAPSLPPLPSTFVGEPILYKEARESDLGRDINEDGDLDDVVVLVQGDADGDGTFDLADSCVETPDPSGADTDGDSLGDVCDPSPTCVVATAMAPAVAPMPAVPCQKAIGKAVQKLLKTQLAATRACQDKIAVGTLAGPPAALCRGAVVAGMPVLPAHAATATKVSKGIGKLEAAIAKSCASPGVLGSLDACAGEAGPLVTCLAARTTTATAAMGALVYGNAAAAPDATALKCAKAAGKAAAIYTAALFAPTRTCLDRVNADQIVDPALCLTSVPTAVPLAPGDPKTGSKVTAAVANLGKAIAKGCPGTVAASLDACGDDASGLASCLTCSGWSRAVDLIGAAYGPP